MLVAHEQSCMLCHGPGRPGSGNPLLTQSNTPAAVPFPMQLGAMGLGTVLFQFAVGFFLALIIATTPRVAAHADNKRMVSRLWCTVAPCATCKVSLRPVCCVLAGLGTVLSQP